MGGLQDGIYPKMLQVLDGHITPVLATIYRECLALGHTPKSWQRVKVVFIPKPGKSDYTLPKSFRPISLTSFLLKGLERLVERHLRDTFTRNGKVFVAQYAFQEGKSTDSALHELTTVTEKTISDKEYALATFMEIEGAFDNVSFEAIGKAMDSWEVDGISKRWISNYLPAREISYDYHGNVTKAIAKRGSPQGGVISPLLWIMLVDELLRRLKQEDLKVIGYADDVTTICVGKFLGTLCERTQAALRVVERWCREVGLNVNPGKTELVVFTRNRNFQNYRAPTLFGKAIQRGTSVKYLGVTFSQTLNWKDHIEYRINKCIRVFWYCRKIIGKRWGLSPTNVLWLHTAIIRPMLSYGSFIWWIGSTTVTISRKLSHLQRVACLAITGAASTAPQSALEALLNLPTLLSFIEAEARSTAFRLRQNIKERDSSNKRGHSSIWNTLTHEECSLLAPSDTAVAKYFFGNKFKIVTLEEGTNVDFPFNGDPWFVATEHDEGGYSFGILHETDNATMKGFLGPNLGPKLAGLVSLLTCCQRAQHAVGVTIPLIIYLDQISAIKAVTAKKIDSKLATECIECMNKLAESREVILT